MTEIEHKNIRCPNCGEHSCGRSYSCICDDEAHEDPGECIKNLRGRIIDLEETFGRRLSRLEDKIEDDYT